VAVRVPPFDQLFPWLALIGWWLALARFRRGHSWLRSRALAVGLVIATFFSDASVVVATSRMSQPGWRSLSLTLLWIAVLLSITTYLVLRTPDDGGDGPGGSDEPPEPPWWPEFESAFRDYARRSRRPQRRRPRTPSGVA
jgi:hypothetical protein